MMTPFAAAKAYAAAGGTDVGAGYAAQAPAQASTQPAVVPARKRLRAPPRSERVPSRTTSVSSGWAGSRSPTRPAVQRASVTVRRRRRRR